MVKSISVVLPACSKPDPKDNLHGPHPFLTKALDSILGARKPTEAAIVPDDAPAVEILIGIDGDRPLVKRAIVDWCRARGLATFYGAEAAESAPTQWSGVRVRLWDGFAFRGGWGNPVRNDLIPHAHGAWLHLSDHDDAYFPDSLRQLALLAAKQPTRPIICKMRVWCHGDHTQPNQVADVLWKTEGRVEEGHIGGHMFSCPNRQDLIGRFLPEDLYSADYRYIRSTLDAFAREGIEPVWSDGFLCSCRPWTVGREF